MKNFNFFSRRVHMLRRLPHSGFVVFNPEADEQGLKFYCRTSTTKTNRTYYWCETADLAKVFDKESTAKALASKLKKRSDKYLKVKVVPIESLMLDTFEIDRNTGEVRACKAWPIELENKAVFKTKLEALNYEIKHKMEEKASMILQAQETAKEIEALEKQVQLEGKKK